MESIEMIKTMKWQSMDGLNKGEVGGGWGWCGGIWGDLGAGGVQSSPSPARKQNLGGPQKAGKVGEARPPLPANNMIRIILPDCKHSHDTFFCWKLLGNDGGDQNW